MSIISKLLKQFLATIFFIVYMNSSLLNAMEKPRFILKLNFSESNFITDMKKQFSKITSWVSKNPDADEFKTISEMTFYLVCLKSFQKSLGIEVPSEINQHIILDFLDAQTIPKSSAFLKNNQRNPDAVLTLINQLHNAYGHALSVHILCIALKNIGLKISDLKNNDGVDALFSASMMYKESTELPYIKIMLDVADAVGDKAFDLISKAVRYNNTKYSSFSMALLGKHRDLVSLFISYADNQDKFAVLLFDEYGFFKMILDYDHHKLLEKILEQADKIGIIKYLMLMKSETDDTQFKIIECYRKIGTTNLCFDIIMSYCKKYNLDDILKELEAFDQDFIKMMKYF